MKSRLRSGLVQLKTVVTASVIAMITASSTLLQTAHAQGFDMKFPADTGTSTEIEKENEQEKPAEAIPSSVHPYPSALEQLGYRRKIQPEKHDADDHLPEVHSIHRTSGNSAGSPINQSNDQSNGVFQEGSPIPIAPTFAVTEKAPAHQKNKATAPKADSTTVEEAFATAQKSEANQEIGKACSSYDAAILILKTPGASFDHKLASNVVDKYCALLRKLNNPQKANRIEKEFATLKAD